MTHLKRNILVAAIVLAGSGAVIGGAYYAWLITPPAMPQTAEQGIAMLGSARFDRMPDYRQDEYAARVRELIHQMPDDQRRDLFRQMHGNEDARDSMRQMMRRQMQQHVRELAEADEAERDVMLDQIIDQQEQRASQPRPQRPPGAGDRRGGGDRGNFRDRMQRRIEEGNPQGHAIRREIRDAIRDRRDERGLPPPPARRGGPRPD